MSSTPHKWNYNFPQIARESGLNLCGTESGIIDWRLIGMYDVEKLIRENDFERLEAAIPHLTEAPLGTILNTSVLDSGVTKYFCLAQLALQYLSFCKDFLDKAVTSLRRNVYNMEKEKQNLMKTYRRQNEELLRMHKKLQRVEVQFEKRGEVHPCPKCTKNFISSALLNNHLQRKHPDVAVAQNVDSDNNLLSNIKLELEIKQLREKLNDAQRNLQEFNSHQKAPCHSFGIQTNFEEEKEKDDTESHRQMLFDSQCQLADLLKAQISALDEWKMSEKKRCEKETEEMKMSLQEAFSLMSQKRRIVLNRTKLDLYSIPADTNSNQEIVENEWKRKYADLEVNYKESYEKMSYILSNLDKKNKDQLLLIGELRKKPECRDFSIQVNIIEQKCKKEKSENLDQIVFFTKPSVSAPKESSKGNISREKIIKRTKSRVLERINATLHDFGIKRSQSTVETADFERIKSQIDLQRSEKARKLCNFRVTRENILQSIERELKDKIAVEESDVQNVESHKKISFIDREDDDKKPFAAQKKVNFYCDKNTENHETSARDKYLESSRRTMYSISSDSE